MLASLPPTAARTRPCKPANLSNTASGEAGKSSMNTWMWDLRSQRKAPQARPDVMADERRGGDTQLARERFDIFPAQESENRRGLALRRPPTPTVSPLFAHRHLHLISHSFSFSVQENPRTRELTRRINLLRRTGLPQGYILSHFAMRNSQFAFQ